MTSRATRRSSTSGRSALSGGNLSSAAHRALDRVQHVGGLGELGDLDLDPAEALGRGADDPLDPRQSDHRLLDAAVDILLDLPRPTSRANGR